MTAGGLGEPSGETAGEIAGARIGRYTLLKQIGEGGMGAIWLAEQSEPVRRRVALKVVKLGMDTRQVVARFEIERSALAMMDHPHIAKVLDAGATDAGRPYFVMEYLEGAPIVEYCDAARLDTAARLRLFVDVCRAIEHAHQKGVVHRDIKPSNVLVTTSDGAAVPKVIDFGIAAAAHGTLAANTRYTALGQIVGTPAYMSPEQAGASDQDVDTRSDLYSLGVLLYELLTGKTPFDVASLAKKGFSEVLRTIREDEPRAPSASVSTLGDESAGVAARRGVDPRALRALLRGDVDRIVLKCLEKDRARRYETASGLAEDVLRHLRNEPVTAGPPGVGYRLGKFVRRHRGQAIAAALFAVALVLGAVGTAAGLLRAIAAKRAADDEARSAVAAAASAAKSNLAAQESARQALAAAAAAETAAKSEAELRARAEVIAEFMTAALKPTDADRAAGRNTTIRAALRQAVMDIDGGRFEDDPESEAALKRTIGRIHLSNGRAAEAEPLLVDVLEIERSRGAADGVFLAASLHDLGMLRSAQGRTTDAESHLKQALAMIRAKGAGFDDLLATFANNLGSLYLHTDRALEAEPLFVEALELHERRADDARIDRARTLDNLGRTRMKLGRAEEARALLVRALDLRRATYAGDHPDLAVGLLNMAVCENSFGRQADAERLMLEAVEMYRRIYQGDHPHLASGLLTLGYQLYQARRWKDSESNLLQAVAMFERLYDEDHPETLKAKTQLAVLYWDTRELDRSIPLFEEILASSEAMFGRRAIDTQWAVANLGVNYVDAGRFAEGVPLLEEVYRTSKSVPDFAWIARRLLEAYAAAGAAGAAIDVGAAVAVIEAELAEARRIEKDDAPKLAGRLADCGTTLLDLKLYAAAEGPLRESLAIRRRVAPDLWQTFHATSVLGGALVGSGRLAEAEPLLQEGFRGLQDRAAKISARERVVLLRAAERLVELYEKKGDAAEAAEWRSRRDALSDVASRRAESRPLKRDDK